MGDLPLLGTNAQIIRIVEALFGVQPGYTYYTNFQEFVEESSLDALSNALVGALAPADAESLAAIVAANYQVDPELETEDGSNVIELLETYITAQLNTVPEAEWGAKILEITNQYANLWNDDLLGESVIAFNDAVVASLVYSANPANPDVNDPDGGPIDPPTVDGENLTLDQDDITGTDANDVFNAFIFNNSNTLQSGDQVDGGAGMDTLFADIGDSQNFAITPHTTSVEKLLVRAEARAEFNDTNDNNMTDAVQIDAERMKGTDWYESNNSRADVIIEDVRIERKVAYGDEVDQVTQDITVAMVSTDPGLVDLGVYFDQHSLVNEGDKQSNSITLTVGNQVEEENFDAAEPLITIPYTNVAFLVSGEQVILDLAPEDGSPTILDVLTYDDMWAVMEAAFDTAKAGDDFGALLSNVEITRSIGTDSFFSKDGQLRTADEYLLEISDSSGEIAPADTGWFANGGLPSNNAFSATVEQGDVTVTSNLVTANILLDDVGRGSMGGDLVVGGLSTGDTSDSKGVEQFDIIVERSSELQEIQSTNNTLEEVYIVNGETTGNFVVAGDTIGSSSDLPGSDGDDYGLTDVRIVDASAMVGTVEIQAVLSEAVVGKYMMDLKDVATDAAADNQGFIYDLGTSHDKLMLDISAENLAAAGTTTREDFFLDISGNGGDDSIRTLIGDGDGTEDTNWYVNSKINANLTVNGDGGDDTIRTVGAGDFNINGGTGNDTVYANNDGMEGAVRIAEVQTLTFGDAGDLDTQGQVTVTFSNGESFTTSGAHSIFTGDSGATVAGEVDHVIAAAGGITGATYTVVDNTIVVTYGATYTGPEDVASASITSIATDAAATLDNTLLTGADSTLTDATFETVLIETGDTVAATLDIVFTESTNTTLTVTDTDGNGTITAFEKAQQIAAHSFTDYVLDTSIPDNNDGAGFNPSLGEVYLIARTAGDLAVNLGDDDGTSTITTVNGSDAVIVEAGTFSTQNIDVTDGADRAGTITLGVDLDVDGVVDADEIFDIAIGLGNEADVANDIAAGINALTGVSAAVNGTDSNQVNVTWTNLGAFGSAVDNAAAITLVDGALISSSVVETTKGTEATAGGTATWAVNADEYMFDDLESNAAVPNGILYNSELTVTFSGARIAASGVIKDAADSFSNGFESTVTIGTTNYLGGRLQVNQAIKDAINNDAVLSKLLMATDGPSNTLVIESLVDGRFEANDLEIAIAAPTELTTAELTGLNSANQALIGDSTLVLTEAGMIAVIEAQISAIDATDTNGINAYTEETFAIDPVSGDEMAGNTSTSDSDNTIELGAGDDVAVLGTDDTSNDTLVYEGIFGNDSIFNFVNTTGNAALDMLDFTAYLTNEVSSSGSSTSALRVATTGEDAGTSGSTLTANEVATVNGFSEDTSGDANETWAELTASDLLSAINGGDYGNITGFNVNKVSGLVGDVQNGIIMVENDLNDGEYKVFSTFADNNDEEFTAVTLVGTIDFGDTIDASVAGALI